MDWKDALGSLLESGDLPEGENTAPVDKETDSKVMQRSPLHVLKEKKGRGGKVATIVEGFECSDSELQDVARRIKQSLGVGGSARGGEILVQGDLVTKVRDLLKNMGYKVKG